MKHHTLISPVVSLVLFTACSLDLKNIGTPADTGDESTGDDEDTASGSSGGTPATTGVTESGGESDTAMTDPTGSTDPTGTTTTGDPGVPGACEEADPSVSADFEVLIDGQASLHTLAAPCVVDAVTTEAATSVTVLLCDDGGEPRIVTLRMPVAPEGAVAWGAGDDVTIDSMFEDFDVYSERHLELRGADDALLAAGYFPRVGGLIPAMFAPITIKPVEACGPAGFDALIALSYQLDFELAGQQPVSVFSGHRGALTVDADERFAIDVESALYNDCCHSSESFALLVRRVKTG